MVSPVILRIEGENRAGKAMSQTTHTGVSGRRSEDRVVPGQQQRQDSSSVADGPFSPAGLKVG